MGANSLDRGAPVSAHPPPPTRLRSWIGPGRYELVSGSRMPTATSREAATVSEYAGMLPLVFQTTKYSPGSKRSFLTTRFRTIPIA